MTKQNKKCKIKHKISVQTSYDLKIKLDSMYIETIENIMRIFLFIYLLHFCQISNSKSSQFL